LRNYGTFRNKKSFKNVHFNQKYLKALIEKKTIKMYITLILRKKA